MLKKILLTILTVAIVVLIAAAFKPSNFTVTRTATIQRPPEKVFPLVNDCRLWPVWSPWENDLNLTRTFSGPPIGKGAHYKWEGGTKDRQGRMEITDSVPLSKVEINVDFIKPEGHDRAMFSLQPSGNATIVTWTMAGSVPYPTKLMTIFVSMDKLIGGDLEIGLDNMKATAEK